MALAEVETVWATEVEDLVPDVFWMQGQSCPMLGGYENGQRVNVDIYKSPFFRPGRRLDDLDRWQRKFEGMSQWLEANEPPVRELEMREAIEGKNLGASQARAAFIKEATISDAQMDELTDFALCPHNPMGMRRLARSIAQKLTSDRSQKKRLDIQSIRHQWLEVRRNLQCGDILGEDVLRKRLVIEPNEYNRKALYDALHAQDRRLAELMLEKRKILIRREPNEQSYKQKKLGFLGYGAEGIHINQLCEWIGALNEPVVKAHAKLRKQLAGTYDDKEPWNRPYWDNQMRILLHRGSSNIPFNEDAQWKVAKAWQLEEGVHRVKSVHSKRGEIAYSPNPPEHVVATFGDGKTFLDRRNQWHEWVHTWHHANKDNTLPYPLRFSDVVWNETMAIDGHNLVYDPLMLEVMGINHIDPVRLEAQRLFDVLEVLSACTWRLQWESWFYEEQSMVDTQSASQYYEQYLTQTERVPDGSRGWANDLYLVEYPWQCVSYFLGYKGAEMIREYATRQYGGSFTQEAMWWKHQKCWWPGGALGWQDLFQHATGKPFSPQPLRDAVERVDFPEFIRSAANL